MPYRTFSPEEAARYLHLHRETAERLVKNQEIPFERHGDRLVFRKVELDAWASQRILGLEGRRLAEDHQKNVPGHPPDSAERGAHAGAGAARVQNPALPAKTKASVLREMAALAGKTGRVCDPKGLLEELEAREKLCSTGLPGGLAILHTRHHEAYLFESSFIVLGRTIQPIPFGAPDGRATDPFFLVGGPDHRLHLHTLARTADGSEDRFACALRQAADAHPMFESLLASEKTVLEGVRHRLNPNRGLR